MSERLPFATEMNVPFTKEEFQLEAEYSNQPESQQAKFNYAWALVRSEEKERQRKALLLFNEIYRQEASRRKECLYYLALGEFKLGNYQQAKDFCTALLQVEPDNSQAKDLIEEINSSVQNDGLVGMALVGAGVAIFGGILAALLGGGNKRR